MDNQNQNLTPSENPDDWIDKEARGDEELVGLLLQREQLFSLALEESKISIHDEEVAARMAGITAEINQRKQHLGIDPIIEP
jgi:hypothetical protein